MSNATTQKGAEALLEEHRLLCAQFDEQGRPARYASGEFSEDDFGSATILCDLSHMLTLVFGGIVGESYASAVFAGEKLSPGRCSFEAVLTGDGSLASCPFLMRTGAREYVVCDASPRGDILSGWMSFVSAIEQQGYAPYTDLDMDDATGTHCVMLLAGAAANKVLGDYLSQGVALPAEGNVVSCDLDAFPCVVSHVPQIKGHVSTYLIFVPPACAVPLWRSFLSFPEVTPVGTDGFRKFMGTVLPWTRMLDSQDAVRADARTLAKDGLLRKEQDFIGARGIAR